MLVRDRVALTLPPLLLRLLLAATFLWLGLGAVFDEMPVQGRDAAVLANMGMLKPAGVRVTPAEPAPISVRAPAGPSVTLASFTQPADETPARAYTAADFPAPVNVRRVHWLTLRLVSAAAPAADESGAAPMPLWPPALAQNKAPAAFAWIATLTSIFGGFFVLIGLLTRFWALLLTALTAGAIWLTVVGPAVQTGAAQFGFLPQFGPFEFAAWVPLAWQVSILVVALAVLFGGPGAASFDRAIFRRRGLDDDDED